MAITLTNSNNSGGGGIKLNPSVTGALTIDQIKGFQKKTQNNTPSPVASFFSSIGNSISGAFKSGVQQTKEGYQQVKNAKNPVQLLEGGAKEGAGTVGAIFSPLAPITSPIAAVINKVADKISNNSSVQKFAMSPAGKTTSRIAEDIGNVSTIAQGVSGIEGGAEAWPKVADIIKSSPDVIKSGVEKVGNTASDFYKNSSIKDWTEPTTKPVPAYNKATQIFKNASSQGHNIADTLVNSGIKLSDNVENKVFTTTDTADNLRSDTGKLSTDLLRPSLKVADYSTPKTPVLDAVKQATNTIQNDKLLTAGEKETAIMRLQKETSALQKKYPNGMSLTDLHDNKITYSQNAGHNPIGTKDDNISSRVNDSIANSLKTKLENTAPKDIPIKEFNKELSKKYQAADYLDALNNKKVPVGVLSKVAKTTAKFFGAAVGDKLGGGLLGGVGGYHLGGILESSLENMRDPIKSMFLNNLKETNPEAFAKISTYLGKNETARLLTKQLPSPTSLGTEKNPIITPSPTTYEPIAQKINRQIPPQDLQLPAPKPREQVINSPQGTMSKIFGSKLQEPSDTIQLGGITKDGYLIDNSGNKIPNPTKAEIVEAKKYGWNQDPKTGKFQKVYSASAK